MTHLAIILPDWNSLESVRRAHRDLEAAALVFFALLVVCEALAHLSDDKNTERRFDKMGIVFFAMAVLAEIAAYPYGQRNDKLSADMIGSLSEKAKEALTDSGTALTNSGTALIKSGEAVAKADAANDAADKAQEKTGAVAKRAEEIDKSLEYMQWLNSARRVQDVDGLSDDLKKEFKGRRIVLRSYFGNEEGFWLCSQLVDTARKAGMDVQDECANEQLKAVPVTDLLIRAPSIEEAESLSMILKGPGRIPGLFVGLSEGPVLTILVGVKPSFPIWPRPSKVKTHNKKDASKTP